MTLSFTSDGKYIVGGSKAGPIGIWEVSNGGKKEIFFDHDDIVSSIWIHAEKNILVSAGFDNRIVIRSLESNSVLSAIRKQKDNDFGGIIFVSISPDCGYIIFCDENQGVYIWDIQTKNYYAILSSNSKSVRRLT
jgi:WD40 repeat protein